MIPFAGGEGNGMSGQNIRPVPYSPPRGHGHVFGQFFVRFADA